MKTTCLLPLVALLCAALFACSDDENESDDNGANNVGDTDAGEEPDAGEEADAGEEPEVPVGTSSGAEAIVDVEDLLHGAPKKALNRAPAHCPNGEIGSTHPDALEGTFKS